MTSSAKPTDDRAADADDDEVVAGADEADEAADDEVADARVIDRARAPWWWRHLPRLVALAATLIGWGFVGWHERFRITPPSVFLCLGWFAVIESVHYLWRAGFSAADDTDADAQWWRPRGARDELEREKRSLLKAIKEIEFDREMGKTTDKDAGEIVRMYRARAIEVIKALDLLDGADATGGDVRDEIERELRARVAVAGADANAKKKTAKQKRDKRARAEDAT